MDHKQAGKMSLGMVSLMALTLAGCSDVSSSQAAVYDDVQADFAQVCKNLKDSTRVPDQECLDGKSDEAKWYYSPIYSDVYSDMPLVGEKVSSQAVDKVDKDTIVATLEDQTHEDAASIKLKAAQNYGFSDSSQSVDADFVKIFVDDKGNRVDNPDDTNPTTSPTPSTSESPSPAPVEEHTHTSVMPLWIPMMLNGGGTSIPPMGSHVDTTGAIKEQSKLPANAKVSDNVPRDGFKSAYKSVPGGPRGSFNGGKNPGSRPAGGASVRGGQGKSGGSVGKGSSRGGFGNSGKAGG